MPSGRRANVSRSPIGRAGGFVLRAAGLACVSLFCIVFVFYCLQPPLGALTLERPNVNVDWSQLPDRQQARAQVKHAPNRLFGTVEFRSTIKNMPQWDRIMRLYGDKKSLDQDFSGVQKEEWARLKAAVAGLDTLEMLHEVNKFFNRWPYRTDIDLYGLVDYWATPAEFIRSSGDCEDYAITKMFSLIQLGVNPANMRLVIIKDQIRNLDHAVLAVYLEDEVYILDNVSPMVLSHSKYGHYRPVLSVNLFYRWAHVPPSK